MKIKYHLFTSIKSIVFLSFLMLLFACGNGPKVEEEANAAPARKELSAKEILGNPAYLAISYGGYRQNSREIQPTIAELKEDMKILSAMGVGMLRTYNVQVPFPHAGNVLEAIHQLKKEDPTFEMYVMLGAWINCENAWTEQPNHYAEDVEGNSGEIERAVALAKKYPDIVKVIAVGNEAMVKWAAAYHVQADVILKWVNHLQNLKAKGELSKDLWVTSSDNFAAWGGGGGEYHKEDLEKLIAAVDFISLHIYPMHETHYNPDFWGVFDGEETLSDIEKMDVAMARARDFGISQYQKTVDYMKSIGVEKPIHIGETGWASSSNGFYGENGTKATDEYKQGLYYNLMRDWTKEKGMACFYFEAFNENWKDEKNPAGSENFFGLFTIDGKAKYALWDLVDKGVFEGLGRGGQPITKTYDGNKEALLKEVSLPPTKVKLVSQ